MKPSLIDEKVREIIARLNISSGSGGAYNTAIADFLTLARQFNIIDLLWVQRLPVDSEIGKKVEELMEWQEAVDEAYESVRTRIKKGIGELMSTVAEKFSPDELAKAIRDEENARQADLIYNSEEAQQARDDALWKERDKILAANPDPGWKAGPWINEPSAPPQGKGGN